MGRKKKRNKRRKRSHTKNSNKDRNQELPSGLQQVNDGLSVSELESQATAGKGDSDTPSDRSEQTPSTAPKASAPAPSSTLSSVQSSALSPETSSELPPAPSSKLPPAPSPTLPPASSSVLSRMLPSELSPASSSTLPSTDTTLGSMTFQCMSTADSHATLPSRTNTDTPISRDDKSTLTEDIIQMLGGLELNKSLVENKFSKLDSLEERVEKSEDKLKAYWEHYEDRTKCMEEKSFSIEERVDRIEFASGLMQDRLKQLEEENYRIKEQVTYLQAQSTRNNLIFCNIPDSANEIPENTESKLRQFLVEKLEIEPETASALNIERAHRMGRYDSEQTRNIVCKFSMYREREMVRKRKSKLNKTPFFLHAHFPAEVVRKRKSLVPIMREAIKDGKRAWISYDTLYIDGSRVEKLD